MSLQGLALVGNQLDYGKNICGAVLIIRFNEDIVSIWNCNASDHQVYAYSIICCFFFPFFFSIIIIWLLNLLMRGYFLDTDVCFAEGVMALRDSIKRHPKLPHSYIMEYKPQDASLHDNLSYRNMWLRG